jgi:hypothetical protein
MIDINDINDIVIYFKKIVDIVIVVTMSNTF